MPLTKKQYRQTERLLRVYKNKKDGKDKRTLWEKIKDFFYYLEK